MFYFIRLDTNVVFIVSLFRFLLFFFFSNDFHVLMAHVQEYREREEWDYQVSISTELTEAMTGLKKWLPQELQWIVSRKSCVG